MLLKRLPSYQTLAMNPHSALGWGCHKWEGASRTYLDDVALARRVRGAGVRHGNPRCAPEQSCPSTPRPQRRVGGQVLQAAELRGREGGGEGADRSPPCIADAHAGQRALLLSSLQLPNQKLLPQGQEPALPADWLPKPQGCSLALTLTDPRKPFPKQGARHGLPRISLGLSSADQHGYCRLNICWVPVRLQARSIPTPQLQEREN